MKFPHFILLFVLLTPAAPVPACSDMAAAAAEATTQSASAEESQAGAANPHAMHQMADMPAAGANEQASEPSSCCASGVLPGDMPCQDGVVCLPAVAVAMLSSVNSGVQFSNKKHLVPHRFAGLLPPSHSSPPFRPPAI